MLKKSMARVLGLYPDYAIIVIDLVEGMIDRTNQHLGIILAL